MALRERASVLVAALAYFALAQAAFAVIGRESVWTVSQRVMHTAVLAAAIIVFLLLAVRTARRAGAQWLKRTVIASAAAAMLGAFAHTLSLGIQVRWGERCNQCTPVAFMIELTLIAGIIAASAAVPVGFVARRLVRRATAAHPA
jgi:hypothetical protein